MNQFIHDLKQLQETGDCDPHDTTFLKNEVKELLKNTTKYKWQRLKKDFKISLENLSYEQLLLLEGDLTGQKPLLLYKIADILGLKEQEGVDMDEIEGRQAMIDHETEKGLETLQAKKDNL
jgi:hypothetical protein